MKQIFKNFFSKDSWSYQARTMPSLDGIRGMAMLLVLISHISAHDDFFIVGAGKIGVWLFFVLSAFLLTYNFLSKPHKVLYPIEWMNYAVRRVFRIVPLYFFILILFFLFNYLVETPSSLLNHFALLEGNGHFWTIAVEMKFYLLLPIVVMLILFVFKSSVLASTIAFTVFLIVHQYFNPSYSTPMNSISLLDYIPVFLAGSLAAVIHNKMRLLKFNNLTKICFDILAVLTLGIVILTLPKIWNALFFDLESEFFYQSFIFYGIIWGAFLLFTLHGKGFVRKVFENKILGFTGLISYSAYLIHPIIIAAYLKIFNSVGITGAIIITILTIVSANVLHRFIEVPFMKIRIPNSYMNRNKKDFKASK